MPLTNLISPTIITSPHISDLFHCHSLLCAVSLEQQSLLTSGCSSSTANAADLLSSCPHQIQCKGSLADAGAPRTHLRACWNVDCWISRKEIHRFERDLDHLSWHGWKVFYSRDVLQSELDQKYDVFVYHIVTTCSPSSDAMATLTLIGVLSSGEVLIVVVLRAIYGVVSKSVYISHRQCPCYSH